MSTNSQVVFVDGDHLELNDYALTSTTSSNKEELQILDAIANIESMEVVARANAQRLRKLIASMEEDIGMSPSLIESPAQADGIDPQNEVSFIASSIEQAGRVE